MNKKSQHAPSETTAWILGIAVLIFLMLIFFPGLMSKIRDTAFAFGNFIVGSKKLPPKLNLAVPNDLEEKYNKFFDVLRENKGGEGGCLIVYNGLSMHDYRKDYSIELFGLKGSDEKIDNYNGWILHLKGKEGGAKTNAKTIEGLKPCIVHAKYFYERYLGKEQERFKDAAMHITAEELTIKDDKIAYGGKEYEFNQDYLFKADKEYICFFLINDDFGGSCNSPKENTLDSDCFKKIKNEKIIQTCK